MTIRVTVPGRLLPVVYKDHKAWAADARRRRDAPPEVLTPKKALAVGTAMHKALAKRLKPKKRGKR